MHGHAKQAGGSLKKIMANTPERAGPLGTSKLAQRIPVTVGISWQWHTVNSQTNLQQIV